MADKIQTLEEAVARFVVDFDSRHINDDARGDVKRLVKDQLAIQIGASQLPWSRQVRKFRNPRPGMAAIVAETFKAAPADAAYINAAYGHGFEYDDFAGNAHPGCCVVPTAFAIGEEVGATLEEVTVALLAGYETYVRIGRLGSPDLLNAGWQPHSVLANFGAAATAAKLYGLNAEQTLNSLAIALSHASGTTEYASTGGSIKRAHAGLAVRNGIESVELALAGVTGPRRFLTGDRGLYRTFIRKTVGLEALEDFTLDAPLQIQQMSFKAYCCCAANHAYIETMAQVRDRAQDIVGVDARIQTMTDAIVGTRNAHIYAPRNIEELQYSLPAQMALSALSMGNGYQTHRDFLEGKLDLSPESGVMRLAQKIRLTVSPELDAKYRFFVADVDVRYRDGRSEHIFQERATGSPTRPFSASQFATKLSELTSDVLPESQANALFDLIDRHQPDMPIREVTALLQRG
ncbi:MmgE/PrpD [Caballeronia hypogeia]|uniref:MmgE/PrpD n=1 Tax=Caballeronia hypogeia TaxID=1777140 RepID=A0A158DN05_9BURK|nr:MmgE/PrpD family protein [Caballeronia hypogeia]SAK95999.1 MmgE/PrpD [Caballeronia hypogeia]